MHWHGGLGAFAAALALGVAVGEETGAMVVLGLAITIGLIAGWRPLLDALEPALDLLRTVLPLALPLIVIVLVGMAGQPPIFPLLIGPLVALASWRWIVAPGLHELGGVEPDVLRRRSRRTRIGVYALIALGLIGAIAIASNFADQLFPDFNAFQDRSGLETTLISLALVLWVLAIFTRLAGYGTALLPAAIALTLAFSVYEGLIRAGLIGTAGLVPEYEDLWAPWVLPTIAGALLAVAGVLRAATRDERSWLTLPLRTPGPISRLAPAFARMGFLLSCFAALAVSGAILIAVVSSNTETKVPVAEGSDIVRAKKPPVRLKSVPEADDRKLARLFRPVLMFSEGERWEPNSVDSYLADATFIGANGSAVPATPEHLRRRRCPGITPAPCYTLTTNCEAGGDRCSRGYLREFDDEDCPTPDLRSCRRVKRGAVYARVLRRDGSAEANHVFTGRGFFGARPDLLVQYWFFYRFNEWTRPVVAGQLVQRHEADWEAVTVGLGGGQPLFVAYSSHCGGVWRSWRDIEVDDQFDKKTHPLIAVAEGSHANYIRADDRRSPNWEACSGKIPKGSATAVGYASNIRDETDDDWRWQPQRTILVDSETPAMRFPGFWGRKDEMLLINERTHPLSDGDAPKSPALQALWTDTVDRIFCSEVWERSGGGGRPGC
jgi:hypothetical protein